MEVGTTVRWPMKSPCDLDLGYQHGVVVARRNDWLVIDVAQTEGAEYLNPFRITQHWLVEPVFQELAA